MDEASRIQAELSRLGAHRARASAFADANGIVGDRRDVLVQLVSELLANAIVHGGGLADWKLELERRELPDKRGVERMVVVTVDQKSLPKAGANGWQDGGGVGLLIANELAERLTFRVIARCRADEMSRGVVDEPISTRMLEDAMKFVTDKVAEQAVAAWAAGCLPGSDRMESMWAQLQTIARAPETGEPYRGEAAAERLSGP